MPNKHRRAITEKDVDRYYKLSESKKQLEKEMKELNVAFHLYFDETVGENEKAESCIGDYKIQRQIRKSVSFNDDKAVLRLEELNLHDCIQVIKKPDQPKIEAAVTLGILDDEEMNVCRIQKISKAITVKKI